VALRPRQPPRRKNTRGDVGQNRKASHERELDRRNQPGRGCVEQ
jgi:hypothetical protein